MRVGRHEPAPGDRIEVELDVFATGSTQLALVEPVLALGPEASSDPASTRTADFHARPGHRPGGHPSAPATTSARAGGDTDVVRPVLLAPSVACRLVLDGGALDVPLPHLRLRDGGHRDDRLLVWSVLVLGDGDRPVPATLHLLGSPSMVVTVLELVPTRRLRWHRDRFVRHGVAAMDELAGRITALAAA